MKNILVLFLFSIVLSGCNQKSKQLKVACIGASNTRGFQLPNLDENCYPGQLHQLAGEEWIVFNGGAGGTTVMIEGDLSYWQTLSIRQAQEWNPDVVVLDFGWNDMKPVNRKIIERDFVKDYTAMINLFADLPSKPQMFMTLPPLYYTETVEEHFNYLMKFYNQIIEENLK